METFEFSQWSVLTPPSGWRFVTGDFTDSSGDDVVGYHQGTGSIWVGANTGDGFSFSQWGTVFPAPDWQMYAGRFTGTRMDILVYHPSNGALAVGRNTGSSFEMADWAVVQPADGWTFATGHFQGGPVADIVGYHPVNGSVWLGANNGTAFEFALWGEITPPAGWSVHAGDFTGNGRTDIVCYHPTNGSVWVGRNTGTAFEFGRWATLSPLDGWVLASGHVITRGLSDVVAYHPTNGGVWVLINAGDAFVPHLWASVTPVEGWTFLPGRFTDDELTDVVGYHAGEGELWVGKFRYLGIEGYCWPLSASAGEHIDLCLTSEGVVDITYLRHVADADGVHSEPVGQDLATPGVQTVPRLAWRDGCGWPTSVRRTIPDDWPSGLYSAQCSNEHGNSTDVTFVVKPRLDQRSEVAVLANVNTWLAYNGWGGASKYSGRCTLSFLRPCPVASPVLGGFDGLHLTRAELWILGWLTAEGYRPDAYTDIDFHDATDLSTYRCIVFGTHPEYWTVGMYDQLADYLDHGGSVLYLGGNGVFERGEYIDDRTRMVFWEGVDFGTRTNGLFRRLGRPERSLLGVATERCSVVGAPYEVLRDDHALFAGTGMANGDRFGEFGLNTGFGNGMASAWEVDTADGSGASGLPVGCAFESAPSPPSQLPDGLEIVARGVPEPEGLGADMTFYRHGAGGVVFSAGSITFGGSLVVDPILQQIVRNALAEAGVSNT